MSLKWIVLAGAAVAGAVAIHKKRESNICSPDSFMDYCNQCICTADAEVKNQQGIIKTILVLRKIDDDDTKIAPFIYRKYENDTIKRLRLKIKPYRLDQCPEDVKSAINNGEYIIKKY